jgi:hypothetical protein
MQFKDAKVGDRIGVFLSGPDWQVSTCKIGSKAEIPAWVLEHRSVYTIIGWKDFESSPDISKHPARQACVLITSPWFNMGIRIACQYLNHYECNPWPYGTGPLTRTIPHGTLPIDCDVVTSINYVSTAPCRQCGITNNFSSKKCYYCETLNPCQLKITL